jgi:predicted HicB family RNase H-like nuclease
MSQSHPKKRRGGPRPGAGRPKLDSPKRKILLHIPSEVDDALTAAAKQAGTSRSEYAERAIRTRLKRDKRLA